MCSSDGGKYGVAEDYVNKTFTIKPFALVKETLQCNNSIFEISWPAKSSDYCFLQNDISCPANGVN